MGFETNKRISVIRKIANMRGQCCGNIRLEIDGAVLMTSKCLKICNQINLIPSKNHRLINRTLFRSVCMPLILQDRIKLYLTGCENVDTVNYQLPEFSYFEHILLIHFSTLRNHLFNLGYRKEIQPLAKIINKIRFEFTHTSN